MQGASSAKAEFDRKLSGRTSPRNAPSRTAGRFIDASFLPLRSTVPKDNFRCCDHLKGHVFAAQLLQRSVAIDESPATSRKIANLSKRPTGHKIFDYPKSIHISSCSADVCSAKCGLRRAADPVERWLWWHHVEGFAVAANTRESKNFHDEEAATHSSTRIALDPRCVFLHSAAVDKSHELKMCSQTLDPQASSNTHSDSNQRSGLTTAPQATTRNLLSTHTLKISIYYTSSELMSRELGKHPTYDIRQDWHLSFVLSRSQPPSSLSRCICANLDMHPSPITLEMTRSQCFRRLGL